MRALVVEDDPMIGRAVMNGLKSCGFAVDWVRDGVEAEHTLMQGNHDLALLDLGLPHRDGLGILRSLRRAKNDIPVLIITARDSIADRVAGLDEGADDYLVKPFDLDELLARTRVVMRRKSGRSTCELRHGALSMDPVKRSVAFRGEDVELTAREFAVLEALMQQPGAVVSRQKLEDAIYGWGQEIESNCVEVYLHHLRRKFDAKLIKNVRGVGYRIALLE